MLRTWLALGAGICCGAIGMRRAALLGRREKELRRWLETLQRLSLLLEESASTLPRAFRQAALHAGTAGDSLRATAERLEHEPGLTAAQAFARCGMKALDWATAEEKEQLADMMSGLGRGSLSMRRQAVDHAAAWVDLHLRSAEEKRRKDGKLSVTLGWTAGACLLLLLL